MGCNVNRLGDFRREMPEWEYTKSALENALARLLKIADEYADFVSPPKEKNTPANAIALDALANLFACTYAYAKDWPNELRRYFSRGFKEGERKEGGVKYGYVQ